MSDRSGIDLFDALRNSIVQLPSDCGTNSARLYSAAQPKAEERSVQPIAGDTTGIFQRFLFKQDIQETMEENMLGSPSTHGIAAPPCTDTERRLLQIWSEVLNTDAIGLHDDFLSLGGDSLAAMRCMNRIITIFNVELQLDLFLLRSADIAQVASEITRMQTATA